MIEIEVKDLCELDYNTYMFVVADGIGYKVYNKNGQLIKADGSAFNPNTDTNIRVFRI